MKINFAHAPVSDFGAVSRDLEDFFGEFFGTEGSRSSEKSGTWSPRSDIFEDDSSYHIEVDLPGIEKKDVKINFSDDVLSIEGERTQNEKSEDQKFFRVERRFGSFKRTFSFKKAVDSKKIKAEFSNGVLAVVIPKAADAKPREIKIQ